jgi:hypothetical protein
VSLSRALTNLPDDPDLERTLRDVLVLFRRHKGEWLTDRDVRVKTGSPGPHIATLLPVLARAFVLDFDSAEGRYRFGGDAVLLYEIDAFSRRVESRQVHVRTNVAKFRERYGS